MDFPQDPMDERNKPVRLMKEGCLMIFRGGKGLIKSSRLEVENGVKYLRRNFWPRVKEFRNIAELNQKTREWLDKYTNNAIIL